MLEEMIQERNINNEKDIINKILKQMKNKNLKFTQFDKDQVMQLHQTLEKNDISQDYYVEKIEDIKTTKDDGQQLSDIDDNVDPLIQNDDERTKKEVKKDNKKQTTSPHKYYHEKYLFHDRNMTIDLQKNKRPYFASFKSVSRDKRELDENRMKYLIPGVGKYNPKFKVIDMIQPALTMSKAELNRTRNFVSVQAYQYNLSQSPSQEYNDKYHNCSGHHVEDNRSKSEIQHTKSHQLNLNLMEINQKRLSSELVIEDHDQSLNNSSILNLTPYQNTINKKSNNSIQLLQSPLKAREGWDNAHGMLDLNKQSERKFVFENLIRVNEQRFNYLHLPKISSKNRKVTGDANFGKGSSRRGLFKLPDYQPMYTPNYDLTMKKNPQLVNMNVKLLKDLYHNIQ